MKRLKFLLLAAIMAIIFSSLSAFAYNKAPTIGGDFNLSSDIPSGLLTNSGIDMGLVYTLDNKVPEMAAAKKKPKEVALNSADPPAFMKLDMGTSKIFSQNSSATIVASSKEGDASRNIVLSGVVQMKKAFGAKSDNISPFGQLAAGPIPEVTCRCLGERKTSIILLLG